MSKTFVVSDTHFGHKNIVIFTTPDGKKVRPWDDVEKMNEDMVQMWNETVSPDDKVYHLGDVVINRKYLPVVGRLNGRKILIKGNHDTMRLEEYTPYFSDIRGSYEYDKYIMTHIPIHPTSKGRWHGNIHGHLHTNVLDDPWYENVSVEQTGFRPILLSEVIEKMKKRQNPS